MVISENHNGKYTLTVHNLSICYKDGRKSILSDINFHAYEGEKIALLGSSGSGKTTFMKCLNQLIRPRSGQIFIGKKEVWSPNAKIDKHANNITAMIFQEYGLCENLSALDNVLIGSLGRISLIPSVLGIYPKNEIEYAYYWLEKVNLSKKAEFPVSQLSGGERQRVAIARALTQKPKIIFADEPVANLDPPLRFRIMKLLFELCDQEKITLITSLHFMDLVKEFSSRVIGLKGGKIFFSSSTEYIDFNDIDSIYESIY